MKKYIFPLFITSLGLFTAYVFYALWHTEEVNPPKQIEKPQEKVIADLSTKPIIPKTTFVVPEASLETHTQEAEEKEMLQEMDKQASIPSLTPEQMQAQTEAVYDSLTPEDYDETMQEANEAFEALDAHVEALDVKLAEEMQAAEQSQEDAGYEESTEELEEALNTDTLELPENEVEIDMENEDVNNL